MAPSEKYQYSINPATEETLASFEIHTMEQTRRALEKADRAFKTWRREPFSRRAGFVKQAAGYLRRNKDRFARVMTAEMGKPIAESEAEVEKCAWNLDYYAENAESHLSTETRASNATESYVQYTPLGVVLAIMPWNYPLWQVFRFAAPALMAGNTAVLKHASNVPQCALGIEEVFRESGLPEGCFQSLLVPGSEVGEIIENPVVAAVTITGSEAAGSIVASHAGRVLKKTVMELGGSDPFIVLADADLDLALQAGVPARYQNTGQSCIAAKRFIVAEPVFERFRDRFVEAVEALETGDPMDRRTRVGPLARPEFVSDLERQVRESVAQGAKIATGGQRIAGRGYFFQPTVLTDVQPEMPAGCEEVFGSVAAMIRAENTEDAIKIANRTPYGLGSSLWTADTGSAKEMARDIEAGQVFINGIVASDPRLPFGGVKRSGYGRELSEFGIREFVNIQTVWVGPKKP
ncbi:MAG: NAD-dependent succinate-semialdehyde dehydrogenase [Acidobacteria bacterium]|nr:NAD-dependent succinate-semialdehyde dehydrogenase [Acidobacteriota bacterium]